MKAQRLLFIIFCPICGAEISLY